MDALAVADEPTAEAASAVRARDLLARTSVRYGVSFGGPVLLVDDTVRTRWTVTVASTLLAEAGASQVMPLAVHLLPLTLGARPARSRSRRTWPMMRSPSATAGRLAMLIMFGIRFLRC